MASDTSSETVETIFEYSETTGLNNDWTISETPTYLFDQELIK